jgi:EAL and modified HD-GYP domain-containing signal transduction protein
MDSATTNTLPEINILFARQPILTVSGDLYGYELLFRNSSENMAKIDDQNQASIQVLKNAFIEMDIVSALNRKKGFVNFTREMLYALPEYTKKHLVIEVLEHYHSDEKVLQRLEELKKKGYTIALDDFHRRDANEELLNLVDIVKLDILDISGDQLSEYVDLLEPYNVKLLAEKVEDQATFARCAHYGFELFQGYYFARPQIVSGRTLSNKQLSVIKLLSTLYQPDVSIDDVYKIVQNDPGMSVKLLKLVNSTLYRRDRQIDSILQACTLLGLERLRSWATLLSLGELDVQSTELYRESLFRAYMCENLGRVIDRQHADRYFTVGLLSCLDAFFSQSMEDLMEKLPLANEVRVALSSHLGIAGQILEMAIATGHGTEVKFEQDEFSLTGDDVKLAWQAALQSADVAYSCFN